MTNKVTIYHNSRCSKSRNTLSLIEEAGIKPTIINYLDTPIDTQTLKQLLKESGLSARQAIRTTEEDYKNLELAQKELSEDALIEIMVKHPKLINRPFVVTDKGTRLCRPPELVKDIL